MISKLNLRVIKIAKFYPIRFIDSVINQFTAPTLEESFLIPPGFFEEEKPFLLVEIPYCEINEQVSKTFIKRFHEFTNNKFKIAVKWITRKVKSLFPLKDRNIYPSCKIYEGKCSCNLTYVGETKKNVEKRWKEHGHPNGESEPAKHLRQNLTHSFVWSIISSAPNNTRTRTNLEALFIAIKKPPLNEQVQSNMLNLFRHGIT